MKNGEHKGVMVEQHMNVLNDTELYIFKNGQMINLRLYIFYHNKKKKFYTYTLVTTNEWHTMQLLVKKCQ